MTQAQDRRETLARVAVLLARRAENNASLSVGGYPAPHAQELCMVSRSLSRIAERGCNEERGCKVCKGAGQVTCRTGAHGALTVLDCQACAGTGSVDGKRERRLEAKAQAIAVLYGLRCYFQGDPRGAALYLIPADAPNPERDDSLYSSIGTAAY